MDIELSRVPVNATHPGTLVDRVFAGLEYAIIAGIIPLGSRLGEEALAKHFGVSRGPLREALVRLEGRGLVTRLAHAGVSVVTLTQKDLVELYEIREMLEGLACRLAAQNMTVREFNELQATLSRDSDIETIRQDTAYPLKYGEPDFHFQVARGTHSARLMRLLCGDLYSLIRLCRFKTSGMPGRVLRAFRDHQRICEAIGDRDADLAELLMRRHVIAARREIEVHANEFASIEPNNPAGRGVASFLADL